MEMTDADRLTARERDLVSSHLTTGARVMLPVFQTGALLFLGPGHARQGDGGVTGTGIETSMDVEFSVEVVKKKEWPHSSVTRPSTVVGEFEQGWPRVETDDDLSIAEPAFTVVAKVRKAYLPRPAPTP
jgi:acetamidase/formamidase